MSAPLPAWSRGVIPAADLCEFVEHHHLGHHDDPAGEHTPSEWLGEGSPCQGDGWDRHPLLVTPGDDRACVVVAGEIRDGRGYHPAATLYRLDPFRDRA